MVGAGDAGAAAAGRGTRMEGSIGDAGVRAGAMHIAGVAIDGTGAVGAAGHGGERRATAGRGREAARGAGSDEVDGGSGAVAEVGEVALGPAPGGAVVCEGRRWDRWGGRGRRRSWWEEDEVGEGKRAEVRNWQSSIENAVADHRGNRDRYLATPITSYVLLRSLLRPPRSPLSLAQLGIASLCSAYTHRLCTGTLSSSSAHNAQSEPEPEFASGVDPGSGLQCHATATDFDHCSGI